MKKVYEKKREYETCGFEKKGTADQCNHVCV